MRLGDYESASPERSPAGAPATATTMMKSPEGG
jgi:hypothetical protein